MNTLLDVLKSLGNATACEIADHLKIKPFEAVTALTEFQKLGQVTQLNGYWQFVRWRPKPQKATKQPEVKQQVILPLSVRFFYQGAGLAYLGIVSLGTGLKGKRIAIEVDREACALRISPSDNGRKADECTGVFSATKYLYTLFGDKKIELTQNSDGWLYGNYGE